jgi:hypothetical protein
MRLDLDAMRDQGVGAFLGRTIEAEAVERMALGGGVAGALALVELGLAGFVLASGAAGLVVYSERNPQRGALPTGEVSRPGGSSAPCSPSRACQVGGCGGHAGLRDDRLSS